MIREIYAKKIGMTQLFDDAGNVVATTLLEVEPVYILEKIEYPTKARVRIGCFKMDERKAKKLTRPLKGYFDSIASPAYKLIREVEVEEGADLSFLSPASAQHQTEQTTQDTVAKAESGDRRSVGIEIFTEGQSIDAQAVTKGKGFTGGMKRHGWSGQPKSHGSTTHRRIGSAGASTYPAKIIKGHRMPGHMGNKRRTAKNLKVIKIDKEKRILFVAGCLPGPRNVIVRVRKVG